MGPMKIEKLCFGSMAIDFENSLRFLCRCQNIWTRVLFIAIAGFDSIYNNSKKSLNFMSCTIKA